MNSNTSAIVKLLPSSNIFYKLPRSSALMLALGLLTMSHTASVQAQIKPADAGTLQRNFESQLAPPSPLGLKPPGQRQKDIRLPNAGETTVVVSRFVLAGVHLIAEADVQVVLKPYLNRPIAFESLQEAAEAIEKLYRARGYLVQANLPPQKVEEGLVSILITEAKLGSMVIDSLNETPRFGADRAAKYISYANPQGQALNLKSLSRAINVLNEIPGIEVTSSLEPGTQEAETNLRLKLQDTRLYSGSKSNGVAQAVVQAALHNPSGFGDQITASGIYAQGSSYTQGAYFLPLLPNGLRGGVSGSLLTYRNLPAYSANGAYGEARTVSATAAYPLVRENEGNANASARLERKTYLNKVMATDSITSSYSIDNLNLSISGYYADELWGGSLNSAQLNWVLGRLNLSDNNPANFGLYTPKHFVKLSFSGSRTQTVLPGVSKVLVNISGQLASQNLNSSEQFYLGGPSGVRAYPVSQGGGAQGALASFEYQHSLPSQVQGSVFIDAGMVQQYVKPYANWQGQTHANNSYFLKGAGVAAKWQFMGVQMAASVALPLGSNPLYNQQGQAVNVDNTTARARAWVNANYNF
jgi:hemolysin activation/secretion protein